MVCTRELIIHGGVKMADVVGGLGELLQNKLFLQYLSGAGADISSGKGLGPNVNAITQQNIQAQNMMKLMQRLMGPDGSKATFSKTGLDLHLPKEDQMLAGFLGGNEIAGGAPPQPVSPAPAPAAPIQMPVQGGGGSGFNPFGGEFPAADLAGLTSQDIATAYTFKQAQDAARQKQEVLLAEQPLKTLQVNKLILELDEKTPKHKVKGVGELTTSQYLAWLKDNDPEGREKFLRALMADPKLKSTAIELARAGAINLGTKIEEKKAMSELEGQLYFNDPKWTEDVQKQVTAFDKDQAWLIPEADRPLAKAKVTVKAIEGKIAAGGGNIQDVKMAEDGKTMIWTVQWPSGDIKKIKHAVK